MDKKLIKETKEYKIFQEIKNPHIKHIETKIKPNNNGYYSAVIPIEELSVIQ